MLKSNISVLLFFIRYKGCLGQLFTVDSLFSRKFPAIRSQSEIA